jgi:hypothetical protein
MATLATILDRFTAAKSLDQAAPRTRVLEHEDAFEVPAFPNEDVYFYIKRINNSQVLREADPAARRACWKLIGSSLVIAALVIGLLLPALYGLVAGYRLEALRQERDRLILDRTTLEYQESKLLDPARLEELAKMQQFVDPAATKVVFLDGKSDQVVAKQTTTTTEPVE